MTTTTSLLSNTFCIVFLAAIASINMSCCYAQNEDRKVYIVYMCELPTETEYSPMSHHQNILQEIVEGSSVQDTLVHSYKGSFNGFSAKLTEKEVQKLSELASFSDDGFGPPPKKWKGVSDGGHNFTCNNKLIGARYYEGLGSVRDTLGHGTHTASTAAGNIVEGVSFFEIAKGNARGAVPSARIAAYKVCGSDGCQSDAILAGFDDAIVDGVDILSVSLGGTGHPGFDTDPSSIGSFHAMKKGILTSQSAGNYGPRTQTVSSYAPLLLTVAASKILRTESIKDSEAPVVVSFSSRGPNLISPNIVKPDISAPGVDILAAFSPVGNPSSVEGDTRTVKYNILSGTSMSCPHATGAAAYVKTYHPDWSPSAIKSALMTTVFAMTTQNSDAEFAYGSGQVDPVKAVNPGLVYDALADDYVRFLCGMGYDSSIVKLITNSTCPSSGGSIADQQPRNLIYPSFGAKVEVSKKINLNFTRTMTNVGTSKSMTYKVKIITSDDRITVAVKPRVLSFKSLNEKKSFFVNVVGDGLGTYETAASLVWSDEVHIVRSPIVVYTLSK
ncbi:hypothetical protein MKX01_018136 [Papaver californicum]|nr:hypothetical protein MKX01_018136 [Papaver californicum]